MKTLFTLLVGCAFSAAIAGCSASATVDPDHDTARQSSEKTTVVHPNGTTDTETHTDYHSNP